MKTVCVKLLLLLSLSFNITHATFIAVEDDHTQCHHDTIVSIVAKQSADTECGNLCELHHLFHFMAIVDTPLLSIDTPIEMETPESIKTFYPFSVLRQDIKPPIA